MSKRTLGSLADLAKIMEEASNPESAVREDRKETKPKVTAAKKHGSSLKARVVDPKRKAWYDKRLREQVAPKPLEEAAAPVAVEPLVDPSHTKAVATKATAGLLQVLANANKPKTETKSRAEAWRRKPGDPVF
ncbi:hypothetical protein [Holophaga foetida]|uniref:hypothetical protein n=1 Tax=Holophaga foetida TaxID=35839 RepID=UPI0002472622|nr:hypothetical protein [Holophaga foetida]